MQLFKSLPLWTLVSRIFATDVGRGVPDTPHQVLSFLIINGYEENKNRSRLIFL